MDYEIIEKEDWDGMENIVGHDLDKDVQLEDIHELCDMIVRKMIINTRLIYNELEESTTAVNYKLSLLNMLYKELYQMRADLNKINISEAVPSVRKKFCLNTDASLHSIIVHVPESFAITYKNLVQTYDLGYSVLVSFDLQNFNKFLRKFRNQK